MLFTGVIPLLAVFGTIVSAFVIATLLYASVQSSWFPSLSFAVFPRGMLLQLRHCSFLITFELLINRSC